MSQSKPRAKPDVVSYGYLIRYVITYYFFISRTFFSNITPPVRPYLYPSRIFCFIVSRLFLLHQFSYSFLLHYLTFLSCFAESKKPRSALTVFHQMRKRRIAPNGYTYMGVLKALSHMRDGLSAVQVIGEMREKGVVPDKKHYAMAMFACVTSNQCGLAESIFAM